ncbi:MAG: hypothetical protein WC329_05860 [Candidatus Omnitrophota bacterium]|jgi:hypothetical protein
MLLTDKKRGGVFMWKTFLRNLTGLIQKVLLSLCLPVVYFLGMGLTVLIMAVFKRKILAGCAKTGGTFWIGAVEQDSAVDNGRFQS